jgi:hypothetical protein
MFNEELKTLAMRISVYVKGRVHIEYDTVEDDCYINIEIYGRKPFTYKVTGFGSALCCQSDPINKIVVKVLSTYRKHILAYYFKEQVPVGSAK